MTFLQSKKITRLALFTALASVLSILEGMFPLPIPLPGVKLGLANIVSLSMLATMGLSDTLLMTILRCTISSLYAGSPVSFVLSLSGGVFSVLIMKLFLTYDFGLIAVSVTGALCHSLAQIAVYALFLRDTAIFSYFPILCISGIFSGIFVALSSFYLIRFLKQFPSKRMSL